MDETGWLCSELRAIPSLAQGEIEEAQGSGQVEKRSDTERSDSDANKAVKQYYKAKGKDRVQSPTEKDKEGECTLTSNYW